MKDEIRSQRRGAGKRGWTSEEGGIGGDWNISGRLREEMSRNRKSEGRTGAVGGSGWQAREAVTVRTPVATRSP